MRRSSSLAAAASNGEVRAALNGHSPIRLAAAESSSIRERMIADVQVARDREQPGSQPGVGPQPSGVLDEPQPGFLEQVLGDVPAARQPHQEREQTRVERRVHLVERVGVAPTKPLDQRQLGVPLHGST